MTTFIKFFIFLAVLCIDVNCYAFQSIQDTTEFDQNSLFIGSGDQADNSGMQISLNDLINESLKSNPNINSQYQKFKASKARIPQAGAWMDPKLSFNLMNFPVSEFSFNAEPMTSKQFSLMQQIPLPGITGIKSNAAEIGSRVSESILNETKNAIIRDVSLAYFDLFLIDKSVEITNRNKLVLENFLNIAAKKYEVGKGLQQDVLKAQVEISKISDKLIHLRNRRLVVTAQINSLINQPASDPINNIRPVEYVPLEYDKDRLTNIAHAKRPLLRSIDYSTERNKELYELSKKQYWPSIDVGIAYSQRDNRRDFFSAQFSINIPLWQSRKQDKKVEESLYNISASESLYQDASNKIKAGISSGIATSRELDERMSLLKEVIIPQASLSLNSAISGYEVDKVDFLTLLSSQVSLFNMELDYFRLLTSYRKNIAFLEFTVGEKLIETN